MPEKILKYRLPLGGVRGSYGAFTLEMPLGARVLHVGMQNEEPYVWALVDDGPVVGGEEHPYAVFGTGSFIPQGYTYIQTYFAGPFVWHLFKFGD